MSKSSHKPVIAVIPGDGIGPEVVAQAVKVLIAAAGEDTFEFSQYELGAQHWLDTGEVLSDETLADLATRDAIILGAVGAAPGSSTIPSGLLERGLLLKLRFEFDQDVNLRPSKIYPGVVTPCPKRYSTRDRWTSWSCARARRACTWAMAGPCAKGRPTRWPRRSASIPRSAWNASCAMHLSSPRSAATRSPSCTSTTSW